jgi:hypothetical protein
MIDIFELKTLFWYIHSYYFILPQYKVRHKSRVATQDGWSFVLSDWLPETRPSHSVFLFGIYGSDITDFYL